MKFKTAVSGAALSLPLFFCFAISFGAAPASTPLAAPVNSLADRQSETISSIKKMQSDLIQKRNRIPMDAMNENNDALLKAQHEDVLDETKMDIAIAKAYLETELSREYQEAREDNRLREGETPEAWIGRMTDKFGVHPHHNTTIHFSDDSPCKATRPNSDGCVNLMLDIFNRSTGEDIDMYLNQDAVGDAFVLVHEIGHTLGIMDECAADQYARSITGLPGGHYC